MIRSPLYRALFICPLIVAACQVACAHNLFVLLEPQSDGPDTVNVIFEHGPSPGKGNYNQPLVDRGQTWLRLPDEKEAAALELNEITQGNKKFLQAETASPRPKEIVHTCTCGVYQGRLDHLYGKYLDVSLAEEAAQLAREPKLPLDIAPSATSDALTITVYFEDQPLVNARVSIWSHNGKEWIQTTDSQGQTTLKKLRAGVYSFAVAHKLRNPRGEFQGTSYQGVMHATTCSLRWPWN